MKHERIEINPDVMFGKPVIKGTRIPVDLILRALGDGMSVDELLAGYPKLTREDVRAAYRFAADYITHEDLALDALDGR
jgi:uncharacterized protein (DUF433 family)